MICKEDFKFLYKDKSGVIYNIRTGEIKFGEKKGIRKINHAFEQYLNSDLSIKEETDFEEYINLIFEKDEKLNGFSYNEGLDNSKFLSRLEIMLCNSCNLKCKYCYAKEGTYGCKESIANPEVILNSLVSLIPNKYNHIKTVMFFGGEPLLNTETIRIVCDFFRRKVELNEIIELPVYTLVTNGTLITNEVAELLSKYKIKTTISIDGPKEIHDKLRSKKNGNGSYDDVERGIKKLLKYKVDLSLFEVTYTTLHKKMGYSKSDIKKYLNNTFKGIDTMIVDCIGETEFAINEVGNVIDLEYNESFFLSVLKKLKSKKRLDLNCDAGLESFMISTDGDIYPCHQFLLDHKYKIGNATDSDLFSNEKYNQIKIELQSVRKNIRSICKKCWVRDLCEDCPASTLIYDNKLYTLEGQQRCEQVKNTIKDVIFEFLNVSY